MKMLLHICCGPCSIYPLEYLKEKGMEIHGYFYNPNIHPYTEYVKRMDTLQKYAASLELPMSYNEDYQMEEFIRKVVNRENDRCRHCYAMRLEETARAAKRGGYDAFTTTLLVSPYQKHELIHEIGFEYGQKYGVPFYYADYRPGYRKATARSRELGMYRQQYCGCIYSEKDRYFRQPKKGGGQRPDMWDNFGRLLLLLGGILVVIGAIIMLGGRLFGLGRLPGDLFIQRGNFSVYFPFVSCIVLSILLTIILNFIRR